MFLSLKEIKLFRRCIFLLLKSLFLLMKHPIILHRNIYQLSKRYLTLYCLLVTNSFLFKIDDMSSEDENDEKSKYKLIPKKYHSLRKVPQYESFIQLRFLRNLDLYLCPRQRKMKVKLTSVEALHQIFIF